MTKERLEELIKQGATIWRTGFIWRKCFIDNIFPLKLDERNSCISMPDMRLWVGSDCFDINMLFETKDKAEWALKTVAERTERFEPPIWEDIKNRYCFGFCKNFGKYEEHYILDVNKNCDINWAITVERDSDIIYSGKATKENYEKACEIVKDMFNKEESNE